MRKEPLFFGSYRQAGHYVWKAGDGRLQGVYGDECRWISYLDGMLPPPDPHQDEGIVRTHHIGGYTVLAFWDRSGDSRPGSNSVFFIPGEMPFAAALAEAREHFPMVFDRFKFELEPEVLSSRPD